jgi:hypothetical protein
MTVRIRKAGIIVAAQHDAVRGGRRGMRLATLA